MMRSLSSAVAGLRTHQTKMDVIGNNIANVNTYGYKTNRATFNDVYYQTISAARSGNGDVRGGQNPTQVGYGAQLATIDVLMTNGGGS
jgi:flagellar hook protein FlgE